MKLHLPTRLRAAVLACITAVAALSGTVGTGTITTGVVAYTIAASQAEAAALVNRTFEYEGVTYSGGALVTLDVTNPANVTKGGTSHTISAVGNMTVNIGESEMTMETGTNLLNSTGKGDSGNNYTLWWDFANNKAYYGQTMRLTGAAEAWTLTFNYGPITFGGLVTEASEGGSYTIGRASSYVDFWANEDAGANMLINATTSVAANSIEVKSNGAWALNKNLTMGANTAIKSQKTITLSGTGALNVSGALTLESGAHITGENNIAVTGALVLDLAGVTAESDALISTTGSVTATALTLNNYLDLGAGSYKLVSTTNDAATALAALFTSTEQYSVSNKSGVVTLTVKDTGIETLTEDLVAPPNFYKYCGSGLNVGEHNITATYSAAGYSALYTKGLQGSGNITFNRTNGGNNLCVLWIDGDASEYTGTIAMGSLSNVFLKLGSDAAPSTDLSAATVNMTKEVIALGGNATIGTLITDQTQIRAVDGTTSNISAMCNAASPTGMQNNTVGFAQKDDAVRSLSITSSATLTNSTINKGVNLVVANGASVTLAGGTVNGTLTNNGTLGLSGSITLSNSIATGLGSTATFANDVVIDLSQLTATEGVYHLLTGLGTSNLGSLTAANITGIDIVGKTLAFDNSGTITLIDNTSDLIWKGGSGIWDETSQNWTKGGNPSVFADADRVTFNETSDVTLVGDLRAGGMAVNADVTLSGSGSLATDAITIGETGSLAINGDATVSVDRENLNKMQVSGSGTLEINKIGTAALAFDGGEAGFSGTLALTQDVVPSGHAFTTSLTNFTGTVVIDALINHAESDFGDASKLVFVGSRATDQIGFWCETGINPTLTQEIEIAGDNEVRFFMNGTTLNGAITGNKLMLRDGTANLGGTVNLARLNFATDNLVVNMLADSTLGELVHEGNRTTLNVGNAEHQVTLNITGSADRTMNVKSHVYAVAEGSVINDNAYLKLTNSTLTLNGGGVYNVRGIELSADGNGVGNLEIAAGTTLHITGTTVNGEAHMGSFMVSHWNATNTIRLDGTLISEAGISGKDGTANININNGGLLQLNAGFVTSTNRTNNATLNVEDGGTLKVASTTTAYNNQITVNLKNGSTFEGFAADGNATIAQNMTIVGTAEAPATAKIKVDADKTLTLSGVIGGENGALNKTGDGTLVLSGTNTYAGGTTVTAGTLDAIGSLSTGDITVGAGSTIILHNKLDATKLTNNGAIEIASGFSGLESAGVTKIDGGAEGNGFNQGGTANLFNGTGVLEGTLSATFNGATVAVAADGTMTLADDWGTYHINNALLETETFSAIKTAATAHSATLSGIDFALASQTLTVDADGFATSMVKGEHASTAVVAVADGLTVTVDSTTMPATTVAAEGTITLHMADTGALNLTGASTLNVTGADKTNTLDLGNGTMSRTLSIVGATVTSSHSGGTGFNTGTTFIGAGGTLSLTAANDALGWGDSAAGTITLLGEAGNVATFELGGRATLKTDIVMQGNSIIKSTASPSGTGGDVPALDPLGSTLTVSGTNNVIATNIRQRNNFTINVAESADLMVTGSVTRAQNYNGVLVKDGAGTLTIASATEDTLNGFNHKAGSTVFSGMTGLNINGEIDASNSGTSVGSISFVNGAEAKINSTLWLGGNASILVDETSTLTKHTNTCDLSISAVTGQTATIAGEGNNLVDFDNGAVTISNAAATVTAANAVEMALNFASTSTVTNAGAGTLTLTNTGVTTLAGVNAQGGDITLNAATSIGSLTIAGGKTVTAAATDPLSITSTLTAGAGSTLSTALSIANSAGLDLATGENALNLGNHAVTLGTGLTITESMKNAITALEADQSLTLFKGVSSLTGGDMDATEVFTGLTGDYTIKVENGNLVVSAAALPSAELTWLGGDGTWGDASTPWTSEGGASAYVEGANVTIGGEGGATGGTITVSGAQTAKNVTIVESGYSIQRAATGTNSLTIQGALTVENGVSFSSAFLPTVGSIVLKEGSELFFNDANYVNINGNLKNILGKISADSTGTLKMTGGTGIADGNRLMLGGQNVTISGANLHITNNMAVNTYQGAASLVVNSGLTVDGELRMESLSKLDIQSGAEVTLGTLTLGHAQAGNPGHLAMAEGSALEVGSIQLLDNTTQNTVKVNGGTLTITGEKAFTYANGVTGAATEVNIGAATLTNGTTDLLFNHSSTLTGATITAAAKDAEKGIAADTTITMGGENLTTNVVTGITTNGNVEIAGTTAISGDTTVTSNGALTIDSISATEGATLTTAGTGSTTISAGSVDKIVANGTTTLGDVTVKNIAGTITQAASTTLTLADGATLDSAATIGAATAAGSLTKTGTATVTTGDITGTDTALAVNGGTLSTGAVSGLSTVTVAQGATLSSTGAVTATGDATINGSLTAGSLTAANITVAQGATVGATTGMSTAGTLTLNDSVTLGSLAADTVSLAADKTLNVTGAADISNLALNSIGATPALHFGSLTSSALAVDVAIATLHDYFDGATGNSVTIATLGATSATALSLTNTQGGGYDYSITLDGTNIVISRNYSGIVWDGTSGAEWGQGGSWQGGSVPGAADNVSFIGNEGTAVTPTVTIAAGGVTAGSVSVTGSESVSADYTFTGGSLTAADLLIENGSLSIANESTFTSGSVETTGSLTVDGADAALELGTLTVKGELTVKSGELTITDTLTTEAGATLAFNGGSSAIGTAAMGSDTIVIEAPASVMVGTMDGEATTVQLAGALNVVKGDIKKIEGISGAYGDLTVGTVQTGNSLTPTVTNDVAIAEASDVNNLTVTGTGNLAAQDTLHVRGAAEVAQSGKMTVAKNTTIDGDLTNSGDIIIGSAAAPATLVTAKVTNNGTITVYNTMTATDDVINNADATLDVTGDLTANTTGKTVTNNGDMSVGGIATVTNLTTGAGSDTDIAGDATVTGTVDNSGDLTVLGALSADTLTTQSGATTDAMDGATITTELTNHGKTTVTGNLVSADTTGTTPGSAIITNDATGTGNKLVVTGNVSGASLTTETGATTEIGGTTTLGGDLTNNGKTTITGATAVAGTIDNAGTLATGALTAETLNNSGSLKVTGNATVKDLSSAVTTSQTNVTGTLTIAEGGSLNTAGDITAASLDLSKLDATDKATVGDLKTDAITLNALSSETTGLTVKTLAAKTLGQKVTVSIADAIVDQLAALEEYDTVQLVTVTSSASTGKLQLTAAAADKISDALDKKLLTYTISDSGVLTVLDNALDKGFNLSDNAKTGVDMAAAAYLANGGKPSGDLKSVTDALKEYRATGNQAAAAQLGEALSGASVAALGAALSNDVERQLRAVRNRTTMMGVNQSVVNENMPYLNAWINAEGDYNKVESDGSLPGYELTSWGGTVGFDVDCTPRFTCGMALSAMHGSFESDGADKADGDLDTYYVSAFARYARHRWTHTFVATAGMAETSLDRTIGSVKVKGDSDGTMFGAMYEVGYVFALDEEATTCLQPIVNVSFTHSTLGGYEEKDSNIGLKAEDIELTKFTVGAGARMQTIVGESVYNRSSVLEGRALVKFNGGDRQAEGNMQLGYVPTASGAVKSTETGAIGAEIGVGITIPMGLNGGSIFADASAEIRAEYINANATVGYRVNF